jgi:hypothetical protein
MAGLTAPQFTRFTEGSDLPKELNRLQDAIGLAFRQLRGNPVADGVLIENQTAGAASTTAVVTHGLGRAWRGFIVTRRTGAVEFYEDISNDAIDRTVRLRLKTLFHPGAPSTISYDIWVF